MKIILFVIILLIPQELFAARAVGDIKAAVVEKTIATGNEFILRIGEEFNLSLSSQIGGNLKLYDGEVFYDLNSEPNSTVMVSYQVVYNSSISKTIGASSFVNLAFKKNSKLLEFDSQGNAKLVLNPLLFVRGYDRDKYKIAYNVTLWH